jgi:hypothetical protein
MVADDLVITILFFNRPGTSAALETQVYIVQEWEITVTK